jgi:hypothetical protein
MFYSIGANNTAYKAYNVAGRSVNYGKYAILDISNVNIHDTHLANGDGNGELGGTLGYSWSFVDSSLKNISLNDVTFDTVGGYGAALLTVNTGVMEIDGLDYNNVTIIRSRQGNNGNYNSALFWTNESGIIKMSNYNVNNSQLKTW